MGEYLIEILIEVYAINCIVCLCWAINNYCTIKEDSSIKTLKYITWGRLLYSIMFLPGLILFYIFAGIIFIVGALVEFFDGKHPFAFLKKQVFKQ